MEREIKLTDGAIILRPFHRGDIKNHYKAVCDSTSELSKWMDWCHPGYSEEESRIFIESHASAGKREDRWDFAITNSKDDYFIGGCGLNNINNTDRTANISYWVRSNWAEKGIATSASRILVRFGFTELKLNRVEFVIPVGNKASQGVAKKIGAKKEGALKPITIHGINYDAFVYSLAPNDMS